MQDLSSRLHSLNVLMLSRTMNGFKMKRTKPCIFFTRRSHAQCFSSLRDEWDWTQKIPFWWRSSAEINALSLIGCCSDLNFRAQVSTNRNRHSNLRRPALAEKNFLRRMLKNYILWRLTYFQQTKFHQKTVFQTHPLNRGCQKSDERVWFRSKAHHMMWEKAEMCRHTW